MTKTEDLERLLQTEAELAEALVGVITKKQVAIVGFKGDALSALTVQEEDLVNPLQRLEAERIRISSEIAGAEVSRVVLRDLTTRMPKKDADRIMSHANRLRTAVKRIVGLSEQNRILLNQSLRYVRETLRIITANHTRKLIDKKM